MDRAQLQAFETRCLQEEHPTCQATCPVHLDARALAGLMAAGKPAEARKILEKDLPLAGLTGFLCEGPCVSACRRAELEAGVDMPLLERACLLASRSPKPIALPHSGKTPAVFGAGLSSLCAAWELTRKSHNVVVFHRGRPGGALCGLDPERLPPAALAEALERLAALRVEFRQVETFELDQALENHPALYLGLDDLDEAEFGGRAGLVNPVTMETADPRIFVGGRGGRFIDQAFEGHKAALSIGRMMQGVPPGTARDREGPQPSKLYTDLSGAAVQPPRPPAVPWSPTPEEARAEAARCLDCRCLECVKVCPYLAHFKTYPKKLARMLCGNLTVVSGTRQGNILANSCADCGLCAAVCPQKVDQGPFCLEIRREMVETMRMPPSAHEFALEDMQFSNSPDIAFFRHQPGLAKSAHLFFPGCQLPASLPDESAALYRHLTRHLEGGVGLAFACCGMPADWSARPAWVTGAAERLQALWEEAGRPELILACPSCERFFAKHLPDLPRRSLWDVLAALPLPPEAGPGPRLALHDPCAARENQPVLAGARTILKALGQPVEELPLGREQTRCCGYGGLLWSANAPVAAEFSKQRLADTDETLLCYCIMCRDRLRAAGRPSLHLLNLLFPAQKAEEAASRPAPGFSARREGRERFRRDMLKALWGEEEEAVNPVMDAVTLHIDEQVAEKLETRRILTTDLKAVLLEAEKNGPQFENPDSGRALTSFRPRRVTFWVEYRKEADGSFTVFDAWCHRMLAPGTPGTTERSALEPEETHRGML